MPRRSGVMTVAGALACAALVLGACSSDDNDASPASTTTTPSSSSTTLPRPSGPAADMTKELTGGDGAFVAQGAPSDLAVAGYVEREYEATGEATAYKAVGELGGDGRWKLAPSTRAPYRTRVLVRAPEDPSKFSGTVVVEWLNVTAGVDTNPDWVNNEAELVRSGDVWVGVSAQNIGVEGGPVIVTVEGVPGAEVAGQGLKKMDPARYGDLAHPGDPYALDIYTQAARAVRAGAGLDGMEPQRLLAMGQSQSAFAMVSYYNGVQPITRAFDGFFVHSRGGGALPLVDAGQNSGITDAIRGKPTIFRTDSDTPVMDIQTESDVTSILNSFVARQDDSDTFRLWEITGTAHADAFIVGEDNLQYIQCGVPVNNGPLHIVAKAALHALKEWVETGTPPPTAPLLDVTAEPLEAERDADAIALGGIRTPPVDVPVSSLSGAPGPNPSAICLLLGSSKPLSDARIAELYSSRADYEEMFAAAADQAIEDGFVLEADRDALLAFAEPDRVAG